MRSPEYRAAFQAVDDSGGLYYFRWGDAPIRTLLVLALLPLDQIHHFRIGGYKHVLEVGDDYRDPLPARTVHPGYPESEDANIIAIAAETGSPLPPGLTVALEETPTPSPLPAPAPPLQGDEPSVSPELPPVSASRETALVTVPSEVQAAGKAKGAIVVLTHGSHERILLLDRAIQSLDESFNKRLRYPIVVFTGVSYGEPRDWLPKPEWLTWLANRTSSRIIFAEVNFSDYSEGGEWMGVGRHVLPRLYVEQLTLRTPPRRRATLKTTGGAIETCAGAAGGLRFAVWGACAHAHCRDACRFFAGRIMDHPVMAEVREMVQY